jgi:hypothetical protein
MEKQKFTTLGKNVCGLFYDAFSIEIVSDDRMTTEFENDLKGTGRGLLEILC